MKATRLSRFSWPSPPRTVRIVHVGIGNFSRAHQAWYTMVADAEREWGISAFTGRTASVAEALAPQQGLYTLIERGAVSDRLTVIDVISEVSPGDDLDGLIAAVAARQTALVTLTVTEAGYAPATADHAVSALGRLALALVERHRRRSGPLAIISCDNLPANGEVTRARVLESAEQIDARGADWIGREVSFVSTSVDRITPRSTDDDRRLVERELGLVDASPVVCEPFSDWVLCGDFPAGRPEWEQVGARFVADIEPWELRKLWLLNGGHSLLAYCGLLRGYETVADAIADPELDIALDLFWDLAERYLPAAGLDTETYRVQLRDRFANGRIGYPLAQIAGDGLDKLRNRVVPVVRAALAAGDRAEPALRIVEAWTQWLVGDPQRVHTDQSAELLQGALRSVGTEEQVRGLLELLSPGLATAATKDH
jgi:fructuronate reductase